jgi:CheY-like chemotaxis protein
MGTPTPENSLAKFRVSLLQPPFWPHITARAHTVGLMVTKFCILQVEDDPNDISLLSFAFQKNLPHHILRSVTSGREARAYLAGEGQYADRDRYPFPHVVLLDLKLPDEDGFEVLRCIRAQPSTQSLIVILFSASVFPGDVEKGLSLGANSYVAKFGDLDELATFFKALEAYWFNFHLFCTAPCLRLHTTSMAA